MNRLLIDLALLPEDGQVIEDDLPADIFELPDGDARPTLYSCGDGADRQ